MSKAEGKKKKRRKKHYLLRLLLFLALCAGAFYLLQSDLFTLQTIRVEGESYYTKEQILAKSGLQTGGNLFDVDLKTVRQTVEQDPYIAQCQIKRTLPDTVVLTVRERTELCAVVMPPLATPTYLILDPNGLALRETRTEPGLPLLSGMTVTDSAVGKAFGCEENALFAKTLEVVRQAGTADLYFKRLHLSKVIVTAYIYDFLVAEGTPEALLAGLPSLHDVILDLQDRQITHGTIKLADDGSAIYSPEIRTQQTEEN